MEELEIDDSNSDKGLKRSKFESSLTVRMIVDLYELEMITGYFWMQGYESLSGNCN
jgi:hypothetical protein